MTKEYPYQVHIQWTGTLKTDAQNRPFYEPTYVLQEGLKPPIPGSADPAFRGDATRWNPEESLVASISACHMLWYLYFCGVNQVQLVAYEDTPTGQLSLDERGIGRFTWIDLHPKVTLKDPAQRELALSLQEKAHEFCFIANSVNFPVKVFPQVEG